jgi:hypothetical protein
MSMSMSSYRRGVEHAPAPAKMDAKLQFGLGEKINWFGFNWADGLLKIRCLCCFCLHNNAGSHSKSLSHPHASKPHRRRGSHLRELPGNERPPCGLCTRGTRHDMSQTYL